MPAGRPPRTEPEMERWELNRAESSRLRDLVRHDLVAFGVSPDRDFILTICGKDKGSGVVGFSGPDQPAVEGVPVVDLLANSEKAVHLERELQEARIEMSQAKTYSQSRVTIIGNIEKRLREANPTAMGNGVTVLVECTLNDLKSARSEVERLRHELENAEKPAPVEVVGCPPEFMRTKEVAEMLFITPTELLRRNRDREARDPVGEIPKPLRGYWDKEAVEECATKLGIANKGGAKRAVVAGAGGTTH